MLTVECMHSGGTTMICPNCRHEVKPGAAFCGICGFRLDTGTAAAPSQTNYPAAAPQPGAPMTPPADVPPHHHAHHADMPAAAPQQPQAFAPAPAQPQAPGYAYAPHPGYPAPPPAHPTEPSGQAIAAIVLGIISVVAWIIPLLGIIIGVLALIFGTLSIHNKKGMAITGIVLGSLCILVSIFLIVIAARDYQKTHGGFTSLQTPSVTAPPSSPTEQAAALLRPELSPF